MFKQVEVALTVATSQEAIATLNAQLAVGGKAECAIELCLKKDPLPWKVVGLKGDR